MRNDPNPVDRIISIWKPHILRHQTIKAWFIDESGSNVILVSEAGR